MPLIQDYASISQAIADHTHRSDLYSPAGGTFVTDYFLQAAQDMINKDIFDKNEGNGIQLMEAYYGPNTITNGTVPVPTNYLAPKFFKVTDNGGNTFTLSLKSPQWLYDQYPIRQPMGLPAFIARDLQAGGNVFIFGPYPDSAYSIDGTYYQIAALLNQSNTTNWMVTSAPNLLFAAAMSKAMLYIKDAAGVEMWTGVYNSELKILIDRDKAERWGSATMQIDTD